MSSYMGYIWFVTKAIQCQLFDCVYSCRLLRVIGTNCLTIYFTNKFISQGKLISFMVFNTQLNSLHKNGETCHRMRAPKKVIINDIRTRSHIQDTQIRQRDQYHCPDCQYCELLLILSTVARSVLYGLTGNVGSSIKWDS